MNDLIHILTLMLSLNNEVVWMCAFTGILSAGLTASYMSTPIWKGMVIAMCAIGAGFLALPWMHPIWASFAMNGGFGGLGSGPVEHLTWLGTASIAALAAAVVAGRVNAPVLDTLWIVAMAGAGMVAMYAGLEWA